MQDIHSAAPAFYHPDPEHVAHNRRGFWVATIVELIGLFIFVGFFNFFNRVGDGLNGFPLILLGLLMSLTPAFLWLLFFYRMDRLEPEPKEKLIGVFVLGALAAAAVTEPLLEGFFAIDQWLYTNLATQLVGGILLVGFLQEGTVYLVVRYGIYGNPEFDERVDGVIYAVCAGLGLATVLNFSYVLAHGGVDLGIGSVRMVVTTLAHASFAGVLGYFLGQARFEKTPPLYLPAGLTLAAVLNGVFFLVEDRVTDAGLDVNPWNGLLLATAVAVLTLAVVFWLVNRANEETLRLVAQQRDHLAAQALPRAGGHAATSPTGPGDVEKMTESERPEGAGDAGASNPSGETESDTQGGA